MGFVGQFGIRYPLVLAPMGGGAGTPELAAAVCNAGGLGSLGAAYLTPEQIAEQIRQLRRLTDRPFNVNLFAGGYAKNVDARAEAMQSRLAEVHRELQLPPPELPSAPRDPFPEQLEAILEARPAVFSFTFGIPDRPGMEKLKERGIAIFGTATTVLEAQLLEAAGADAVVAQGAEAGAHRGTFAGPFEEAMTPTLLLVEQIRGAVGLPVIASGGLMDGRDVTSALAAGASAVQLGTAFLRCPECGASEAWKQAIREAATDMTVITRAFSGRPARGLANEFTRMFAGGDEKIPPFPVQNIMTRPLRAAAARLGRPEYLSLWAGQGVARSREMPAGELVQELVREMERIR